MTKDQFIDHWRHHLAGMVLDAAMTSCNNDQRSLFLRGIFAKIDKALRQMHEHLQPPAALPVSNGQVPSRNQKPARLT